MGDAGGSYGMVLEMLGLASLPLDWGPIVKKNNRDQSKQKENNKNTPNSKQKYQQKQQSKMVQPKIDQNVCLQLFHFSQKIDVGQLLAMLD